MIKEQAKTLRKLKSLNNKPKAEVKNKDASQIIYKNIDNSFKSNLTTFVDNKIKHGQMKSVSVTKRHRELKNVDLKMVKERSIKSIDRQDKLIKQIDSFRHKFQLEKANSFNNKLDNAVSNYSSMNTAEQTLFKPRSKEVIVTNIATPVTHKRPTTAKLYSFKPDCDNISKTPLQEFLEMKRNLCFNKKSEPKAKISRPNSSDMKNTEMRSEK